MGAVESNTVKSARKANGKLHKACERASETRERTLHGQEQNRMRMASSRDSRDRERFLVNTQVQSHALLHRGFGSSVPFIYLFTWILILRCNKAELMHLALTLSGSILFECTKLNYVES